MKNTTNGSYNYPLLNKITDLFKDHSKEALNRTYICGCQHILEPQGKMFKFLVDFGIPNNNINILGKIYSTSNEILNELKASGFKVEQPQFDLKNSFDVQHVANCLNLYSSFVKDVPDGSQIIVIDDGGDMISIFNKNFNDIQNRFNLIGIEQTSSGFRKLEKEKLNFPVINVARSPIKLDKESPLIARLGCDRINDVIKSYSISEPRILVIGLGPMGNNVQLILKEEGYFVIGHDIIINTHDGVLDLVKENSINIIIGVTGTNHITEAQVKKLSEIISDKLYLISMSSSDREFPSAFLRQESPQNSLIHSDAQWKNIILVNNGFPITFKGKRYESTPIEIERTIALLYGSALYASLNTIGEKGFVEVPKIVTDAM
jgi:S-adenosylhomocysteine hydrolase